MYSPGYYLLDRKYLMLQIQRLTLVPIFWREIGEGVARIVTGIVDEHTDGTHLGFDLAQVRLVRLNVRDVAHGETRRVFASRDESYDQRRTRGNVDVAESYTRALLREVFHQRRANTGAAARYEYHAVFKTCINCVGIHRGFFRFGQVIGILFWQFNKIKLSNYVVPATAGIP